MQVSLVMFKSDGTRRDFPVTGDRMVVGRKNNCDLRIPLSSVSRQHCEIRIDDETVQLRDLGSSNGTFHNHIRVQEATLTAGDEVLVGPVVFTVIIDGEPEDVQPVPTSMDDTYATEPSSEMTQAHAHPIAQVTAKPNAQVNGGGHAESGMEPDATAPTVDLDEDPIAALERLAAAEHSNAGRQHDPDDSDFDFDFDLDDDELKG